LPTLSKSSMKKIGFVILIVLIMIGIFNIMQEIASRADYINNDFLVFWLAGHANWADIDPYSSTDWLAARAEFGAETMPEPEFLYPLPLSVLLAPLGLFSIHQAFIVWGTLSVALTIFSIIIILHVGKEHPHAKYIALPIVLLTPLFPPLLLTLNLGQFSAFLLFFATLAAYFWDKGKNFWGGFFIAFFTIKPNIGAPLLLLTSIWLLSRKKRHAFIGILTSSLLLLAIGLLRDLHWVSRFLSIIGNKASNTFGYSPTLWGISGFACQFTRDCTIFFGATSIVLFALLSIWVLYKNKAKKSTLEFGIILTLSLLFAPYLWPYDQLLLLIPTLLSLLALFHRNVSPIKLLFGFIGIAFIAIFLGATANYLGHQHENLYVFLSLLVFGISIWVLNTTDAPYRAQP